MRVLVTGAVGLYAVHLVDELVRMEEVSRVFGIDDFSRQYFQKDPFIKSVQFRRKFELSVRRFYTLTPQELNRMNLDAVIHLAARTKVGESLKDPEGAVYVNVLGTARVLDAAREKRTKTVVVGACLVYRNSRSGGGVNERSAEHPLSPYAASKLSADHLALAYVAAYHLPAVSCRPFNTYGPFQKDEMKDGVVAIFLNNMLDGEPLTVFGAGTQTRDLIYVGDCAEFLFQAATSDKAVGEVINAGTGRSVTINELAALICEDPGKIKHAAHPHPQSEIRGIACDYSKAKALLGWRPKTNLVEGIARTRAWMTEKSQTRLSG